jgi:hypothetical protein
MIRESSGIMNKGCTRAIAPRGINILPHPVISLNRNGHSAAEGVIEKKRKEGKRSYHRREGMY